MSNSPLVSFDTSLGVTATTVQAGSAVAAGVMSVPLAATAPTGMGYLGLGASKERVQVLSVTGSAAPYTANLAAVTTQAHPNGDPYQSYGYPHFWTPTNGGGTGDVATIDLIPDRFGVTRPVKRLDKVSTTVPSAPLWTQNICGKPGPNAFTPSGNALLLGPEVDFPHAVEISVWSKGQNIAPIAGQPASNGVSTVFYYYDELGTVLNNAQGDYYASLGPNGTVAPGQPGGSPLSGAGYDGSGTWDWTETHWRMVLRNPASIATMSITTGFHDGGYQGTVWLDDITMTPSA